MKAIQINAYGASDVLRIADIPRPVAGAGEVLVRIAAAGVNPLDWKLRAGYLKEMLPLALPWTPGGDFSGVIEAVGADVVTYKVGDEVFGKSDLPRNGSYAEFVAVPADGIARKPSSIDHVAAAAIPGAALTAWQALFEPSHLNLQPGQTLLLLGGAGGVGSFAVQFAKSKGARVVVVARTGQRDYLLNLGADTVVNSDQADLSAAGPVDAVLDLVGGALQESAWPQVKTGGSFVSTLSAPSAEAAMRAEARASIIFVQTNADHLTQIAELIGSGEVQVPVTKTLPLEQARQAHDLLEAHGIVGKLVLSLN